MILIVKKGINTLKSPKIATIEYNVLHFEILMRCVDQT